MGMKMRRFFKNRHAAVSSVEFAISSIALISSIAVVTVSVAVPSGFSTMQYHVDVDAKAQEITSILLSPSSDVGLAVDVDTTLEIPSTIDLPETIIPNQGPDLDIDGIPVCNPNPVEPDASFGVSFTILNLNTENAIDVKVIIYDGDINNGGGTLISDTNVGGVSGGGSKPVDIAVNPDPPLSLGSHTIAVLINPLPNYNDPDTSNNYEAGGTINVQGNTAPTASFDADPNPADIEETVNFDASGSSDPDGTIVLYEWDWDEDEIYDVEGETQTHSWDSGGSKTVTLRVTDDDDATDTDAQTITINEPANDPPTTPVLSVGYPKVIIAGLTLVDDGKNYANVEYTFEVSSTDEDGDQINYTFDWNDETSPETLGPYASGSPCSASYLWTVPSAPTITVLAEDGNGGESEMLEIPITILANSKPENPGIIEGQATGSTGEEIPFSTYLEDGDEGDQIYYLFDWGDETDSGWLGPDAGTYVQESHVFENVGEYDVVVRYVDTHGALIDSDPHRITISSPDEPGGDKGLCFIAGTQIVMADSSLKNIEDIKVGDKIRSYDQLTNTFKEDKIVHVFHDSPEMMMDEYYLLINDNIGVTTEHPLFINGKWIRADELKVGDPLAQGVVNSIEKVYERVPTYNFETEIYHTYLVKSDDDLIIAHNANYATEPYKEEIVTESEQISATDDDYPAIISMGKIESLREYSYDYLKNLFGMPEGYDFLITIRNKNSVFAVVGEDGISVEGSNVRATQKESVIIYDSSTNQYIFAILQITIFR